MQALINDIITSLEALADEKRIKFAKKSYPTYAWREGLVGTATITAYFEEEDYWLRRVPLVATVALNQKARGGTGDAKRTLEICKLAIDDHQDMINKALSWALRELAKVDARPVEAFLDQYQDRLHSRVLREVPHKLEKGTKN